MTKKERKSNLSPQIRLTTEISAKHIYHDSGRVSNKSTQISTIQYEEAGEKKGMSSPFVNATAASRVTSAKDRN